MIDIIERPYPATVRPHGRETLSSWTERLLKANDETPRHLDHLARLAVESGRYSDIDAARFGMLITKAGLSSQAWSSEPVRYSRHDDGDDCADCRSGIRERIACTLCTRGETVTQVAHLDAPVCLSHQRWVGLRTPVSGQHRIGAAHVRAGVQYAKLKRRRLLDAHFYRVAQTAAHAQLHAPFPTQEAAAFPSAVAIMWMLTRVETQRILFDPIRSFTEKFSYLRNALSEIGLTAPESVSVIWLYLRPTHWAIRDALRRGAPYQPAMLHDFPLRRSAATDIAGANPQQLEPFESYLLASGDTMLRVLTTAADKRRHVKTEGHLTYSLTICNSGHPFVAADLSRTGREKPREPRCPYCTGRTILPGYNDLRTLHRQIADELDPDMNAGATADVIRPNDRSREYFWRCRAGHVYSATPHRRTVARLGCPICYGGVVVPGVNDLATTHLALGAQLRSSANGRDAWHLSAGSDVKCTWECDQGHTFSARIIDRVRRPGCPQCAQSDNLTQTHPHLLPDWDHTANGDAAPEHFTATDRDRVAWTCPSGHCYEQRIDLRARGAQCPTCNKAAHPGTAPLPRAER